MSNKKRISRFVKEKKQSLEIKSLRLKNGIQQMQLMIMKISLTEIAHRKRLKSYPLGGFIGEIGDEIILGKNNYYQVPKHAEAKAWLDLVPRILEFKRDQNNILNPEYSGENFEKYKSSWIEEFKNSPDQKKPFLKYLIDRNNLEVPFPDQFKIN